MADSGYFVGDKATGVPLKTHLENEGIDAGAAPTGQVFSDVSQNDVVYVTHAEDALGKRIVQVSEFVGGYYTQALLGTDYAAKSVSNTQTKVTKLTAGTVNIKVNIVV